MQIYTKILIGMAVGTVIGLAAGPRSPLLEHDLYQVSDASTITLQLDREVPNSTLIFPKEVALRLTQIELVQSTVQHPDGGAATRPSWAKVRFKVSKRLTLLDEAGVLAKQLGGLKARQTVEAWLRIEQFPLEGGGFRSSITPVSTIGDTIISWMRPAGTAFIRLIKMVIVPLVFSSLLVGVASLGDVRRLGRLGGRTLGLYLVTTAIAVAIGLLVAYLIQPGSFIDAADRASLVAQFQGAASGKSSAAAAAPSAIDNFLNIIPTNPAAALAKGNMLQTIFFAVVMGVALTMMGERGEIVVRFFDRVQEAMVVVIHLVMSLAPYGVAALLAEVVGTSGLGVIKALLAYSGAVLVGLALHTGLVYCGLVKFGARLPVLPFLRRIREPQLIAFSTSSSSATLPVSMECAEEQLGISKAVSSFVLPLGSTVNMDGTALYQGVAAVFIAQVFNVDLTLVDQLTIVLTATLASIGAAGVPGAGMVTLAMVLTAAGIPQVGLALILGMDRLLDMFRTAVNVTGDLSVTAVLAVGEGETLVLKDHDTAPPQDPG